MTAGAGTGSFLFVVPPLAGHVNPTVPVAHELAQRGHEVAWTGHPEVVTALLPPGATFVPAADALPPDLAEALGGEIGERPRGPAALKWLWEDFITPLARQMVPGVHAAVDAVRPDVLVVDQQALAGAAVAAVRGLPWATSATTSAELVDPLAVIAKAGDWVRGLMRDLLADAGLDADEAAALDPRFSPHLVLAFTTEALVSPPDGTAFPDHYALVGPSTRAGGGDATPFPWDWIDESRPLVLVSLGTLNWRGGSRFFGVAARALAELDVQAVFVAPPDLVPDAPDNVLVVPRVPQLALLPHVDAVVTHGGHNTVCEALAQGIPLVVAPIRDDQPVIAEQVASAGAGIRVKFGRVGADALREAVGAVLAEPGYREAADRVRASFAASGGAAAAAQRLDALLASRVRRSPPTQL